MKKREEHVAPLEGFCGLTSNKLTIISGFIVVCYFIACRLTFVGVWWVIVCSCRCDSRSSAPGLMSPTPSVISLASDHGTGLLCHLTLSPNTTHLEYWESHWYCHKVCSSTTQGIQIDSIMLWIDIMQSNVKILLFLQLTVVVLFVVLLVSVFFVLTILSWLSVGTFWLIHNEPRLDQEYEVP